MRHRPPRLVGAAPSTFVPSPFQYLALAANEDSREEGLLRR